jgi:hypothetical protein
MLNDMDYINGEIDRRKVAKLVDDGILSEDELRNAPVVLECPVCKHQQSPFADECESCGGDIS